MPVEALDAVVVGAGIVGAAVARALALAGREVTLLEAEDHPGQHASSRNSEVIHAGIYYPPGSLKARTCIAGRDALYRYCSERGIAHRRIGKVLLAVHEAEVPELMRLEQNARTCGVDDLRRLDPAGLRALEPEVEACAALLSPSTGIVDSHGLLESLLADLQRSGGTLVCRTRVNGGSVGGAQPVLELDTRERLRCRLLVNCAGAQAPALAHALGVAQSLLPPAYFVRGQWFALQGRSPFGRLVYPLPEPGGLGIHVTLDLGGTVRFGPDVQWADGLDYRFDADRDALFRRAIARYYPGIAQRLLQPAHCGIRARISGPGEPVRDFRIDGPREHGIPGLVNLFGIESPGLTAALALADRVCAVA